MNTKSHRKFGQPGLKSGFKSGLKIAAAAVLVTGLSACGAQSTNFNSEVAHPVKVTKKTTAIAVRVAPTDGSMTLAHQARLKAFVIDYARRAQSPMLVMTAPGIGQAAAESRAGVVRDKLIQAGMRPGEVILKPGMSTMGGKDTVVISFRGYTAQVPTCGDWSTETTFMPNNATHGNYGCAYQRNIGLMVSNPRDLVRSETPDTLDATKRTQVILNSRIGENTGSAVSATEESGVGSQ